MRDEQVLGPRAVDGVAEAPAPQRAAALRVRRVQAVEALPARRDGADDHSLPDTELVIQSFAELVDDADGLVSEDQPLAHRVLPLDDVHVGAADGRRGNPDDGFTGLGSRFRDLFNAQVVDAAEHNSLHHFHNDLRRRLRPPQATAPGWRGQPRCHSRSPGFIGVRLDPVRSRAWTAEYFACAGIMSLADQPVSVDRATIDPLAQAADHGASQAVADSTAGVTLLAARLL